MRKTGVPRKTGNGGLFSFPAIPIDGTIAQRATLSTTSTTRSHQCPNPCTAPFTGRIMPHPPISSTPSNSVSNLGKNLRSSILALPCGRTLMLHRKEPLVLDGHRFVLRAVSIDGDQLPPDRYSSRCRTAHHPGGAGGIHAGNNDGAPPPGQHFPGGIVPLGRDVLHPVRSGRIPLASPISPTAPMCWRSIPPPS